MTVSVDFPFSTLSCVRPISKPGRFQTIILLTKGLATASHSKSADSPLPTTTVRVSFVILAGSEIEEKYVVINIKRTVRGQIIVMLFVYNIY